MSEEKDEIKKSEEDEKSEEESQKESEYTEKKSEEEESQKESFEKESETVSTRKYNQAIRKQREVELEKRELERQLAESKGQKFVKEEEKEEDEDDENESFFEKEEEKKEKSPDFSKLVDEKLKPVLEAQKKREDNDRKNARTAFFEEHPDYLKDSEKWQGLIDEMDNSLNPNSSDDYYTQLEKAHRILAGDAGNAVIEDKKAEIASDSSGAGAEKGSVEEEFSAEDRKTMKDMNISPEGMRAFKKQLAEGKTSYSA